MEIVLYVLAGLVLLIVLLSSITPVSYEVKRDIVVNKPSADVFQFLKQIKNQNIWSPWKLKDSDMEQSYEGTDGEVGFVSKWKGNKHVGEGEQEILEIVKNQSIKTELRFFKPWKSVSSGYLLTEEVETGKTKVIWVFRGRNPRPLNIMTLFVNFERVIAKDFESGLNTLKQYLENNSSWKKT